MANRVLVIEDDSILRRGLAALVGTRGHQVATADTVAKGMEQLLEWGPTHILLDMNLPDGVGTTILRHVRDEKLPVRVAVVSGSVNCSIMAEVDALAPDARFGKPTNWDALLNWVAAAPQGGG